MRCGKEPARCGRLQLRRQRKRPWAKGGQVAGLWGLETARPRILSAGLWEGTPPAGTLIVALRD